MGQLLQAVPLILLLFIVILKFHLVEMTKYHKPTIIDYPLFDAAKDATTLRKAIKGWGTNEKQIIAVLTQRSLNQRMQIFREYERQYKKSLKKELESEAGGKFGELLQSLVRTKKEFYAAEIHAAVTGAGTDDTALTEIFCCLQDVKMDEIKQAYKTEYKSDMKVAVEADVSGNFADLLDALIQGKRRSSKFLDKGSNNAKEVAKSLVKAGVGIWLGTDEKSFIQIFSETSYAELAEISKEYKKFVNSTLAEDIEKETSGYFQSLLTNILHYAENPISHYALLLHSALQKIDPINDRVNWRYRALTRVLVERSEIDLKDITDHYMVIANEPLESKVRKVFKNKMFNGDYKNACLSIIKGNYRQ